MNRLLAIVQVFFSQGHSRSVLAKKNIFISLLIKGASILINLAFVPLLIDYVGASEYGVWLTISSVVAWFAILDIGLGQGLRNRLLEATTTGNIELGRSYVSTTYALVFFVFLTLWFTFLGLFWFVDWNVILNLDTTESSNISLTLILLLSFFCMQMVLKIINAVVSADQKPAVVSVISFFTQLLMFSTILILVNYSGGSLLDLALVLGGVPVLVLILANIFLFQFKYWELRPSVKFVDFSLTKRLFGLGASFFFINIGVLIVLQTTNLIILKTLDSTSVTIYSVVRRYFFVLSMIFIIIINPFWSAFTDAYLKGDFEWMRKVLKKLERIWLVIIPMLFLMVMLNKTIFALWIGDRLLIPQDVIISMAIYVALFAKSNMYMYLINGIGKVRIMLIAYLLSAIMFIPVAIFLVHMFGLVGIIYANILVSLGLTVLSQQQIKMLLNNNASGIWNQ